MASIARPSVGLRRGAAAWRRLGAQLWTGIWTAALALALRAAFGAQAPGLMPFPLIFVAVLAATLMDGWIAGAAAIAAGAVGLTVIFVEEGRALRAVGAASPLSIVLMTVCACAIVMLAERHRLAVRALRSRDRQAADAREQALAEQLRLLDNASTFVCVLAGPDHRFVYANETCLRLSGREALVGFTLGEAIAGVSSDEVRELDEVLRTGQGTLFRGRRIELTPGEARYLDLALEPVRDADGEVTAVSVAGYDITDLVASRAALEESERRLRLATEAAGVGIWEWRLDTGEMIYSAEARAICGFTPDEPLDFARIAAATHPEDFPRTSAQAQRALDPQVRDTDTYEYRIVRPDGEVRWVTAAGHAVFELRDGCESAVRYVGTLIDITERRLTEEATATSEQRLSLALHAGRMGVWEADRNGALLASPSMNELIGLPRDATPSVADIAGHFLPGELERFSRVADAARDRGELNFDVEFRFRRADGQVRWFDSRAQVRIDERGEPAGVIGVAMDITERKHAQERLQLLNREIDHRANNLLSVAQGTVQLSQAESAQALKEIIIGRLQALARAHQLLSDTRWRGADLLRLVREEMLPFSFRASKRVTIEGPALALRPAAAQAMAMAIHELATNAAKHGALSVPDGCVRIAWSARRGRLLVRWREEGGPPASPPTREGFGGTLLRRVLEGPLRGATRLDWRPDGLICELEMPLDAAVADDEDAAEPAPLETSAAAPV